MRELERCIQLGFGVVTIDPNWCEPIREIDAPELDVFYSACASNDVIVVLTTSVYVGRDLASSHPSRIQAVAERHPELMVVVSHVCWPHVTSFLGVAFRYTNVYALPDMYLNIPGLPGARDLIEAANGFLQHRMLFSSVYPSRSLGESVESFRSLPIAAAARDQILGGNAIRLLRQSSAHY